jgi:general secretion pathway protein D
MIRLPYLRSRTQVGLGLAALAMTSPVLAQTAGRASSSPASSSAASQTPVSKQEAKKAEDAYLAGARWVDRHDLARAEPEFRRAAALNPGDPTYALALARTRDGMVADLARQAAIARDGRQTAKADALIAEARLIEPESSLLSQPATVARHVEITPRNMGDLNFASPIEVSPARGLHEFHLKADTREVVRQVASAYGVQTTFADDVPHTGLAFALEEAPYSQSMGILLHMTHLFAVALNPRMILVVKDTQENRQKYEPLEEETIYVPGSTNDEMGELLNVVKNVFDVKQISVLNGSGTILLRAPEETLKVVNATLADLIDGGAEVLLELKLYEVDKSFTRNTGATFPQQFGGFSVAAEAQSIVAANQSAINQAIAAGAITLTGSATQNLLTEALFLVASGLATSTQISGLLGFVGGGLTTLGIYQSGGANFNLALNSSEVRIVDDVQVRIGDGQTNTFKVGSKYPITTATYSTGGGGSNIPAGLANTTINGVSVASLIAQYTGASATGTTATTPQVQYEDLGITLKTKPVVEKSGLVNISVDMKIEALTGSSLDGNPVLSSRVLVSDVSVLDGASAVIVSSLNKDESGSLNGLPGLSDLPGFQDLTGATTEKDSTELVMILTPHIVRHRSSEIASPRIAFHSSAPQDF